MGGRHAFYVFCLDITFSLTEKNRQPDIFFWAQKEHKLIKKWLLVVSADQIIFECRKRLGLVWFMVWFIQYISVINVSVDLVQFRRYVFNVLVNIPNKSKWQTKISVKIHRTAIFTGTTWYHNKGWIRIMTRFGLSNQKASNING